MGDMCGHSLWNVCVIHCKKLSLFLQNVETNRGKFPRAKQSDFMDQISKKFKRESDTACIQAKFYINHPAFSTTTVLHKDY